MAKKLLVSLAMEGKFCRDGLQALEEDDDMLTAMARELVTEGGVGESADIVWRQIQAEHKNIGAAAAMDSEPVASSEELPIATLAIPPALNEQAIVSILKFGVRPPAQPTHRPETHSPAHEQFTLF
jgi:hypothetical protein